MEIDKTDSHIFTATTTTTRMNISLETGKLRDTHSEGKVILLMALRSSQMNGIRTRKATFSTRLSTMPNPMLAVWSIQTVSKTSGPF
jgi:hypothetical protein